MMTKAVIFDLDGTLYDNTRLPRLLILHNLLHLRMLYAERMSRHRMSGRYFGTEGKAYDELFSRMSQMTGKSIQKVASWYWERFMPLQAELLQRHFHPKPWVVPLLTQLREKGVRRACFSDYSFVREKLMALGIGPDLFDVVIDAPSVGGCKPSRKAFCNVAGMLGVNPHEVLVIGDREDTDGAGAEAAEMKFQLVPKSDADSLEVALD